MKLHTACSHLMSGLSALFFRTTSFCRQLRPSSRPLFSGKRTFIFLPLLPFWVAIQ